MTSIAQPTLKTRRQKPTNRGKVDHFGLQMPVSLPLAGLLRTADHSSVDSAFMSLASILEGICHSNSWAYSQGLVPKFDKAGARIDSVITPPFPWEVLPDPVIKFGKKLWLEVDVDAWIRRVNARARQSGLCDSTICAANEKALS